MFDTALFDDLQPTQQCSVDGCGRIVEASGLCHTHRQRQRRGSVDWAAPIQCRISRPPGALCSVEGCDLPLRVRGFCGKHYNRERLAQKDARLRKAGKLCTIKGCTRTARTSGLYCGAHYARVRAGASMDAPIQPHRGRYDSGATCDISGCSLRPKRAGLCNFHDQRRRSGIPLDLPIMIQRRPERSLGEGRRANHYGYVMLSVPPGTPGSYPVRSRRTGRITDTRIFEHRFVMQELLGRPLQAHETPHHLNGDKSDNRPENLELWSKHQPSGQRVVDKVVFAVEILLRYPDFTGLDLVDQAGLLCILERVQKNALKKRRSST
jgi:hypothetical protein